MKTQIQEITPQLAQELLEKNTSNRPLKPHLILNYLNQMNSNLWREDTGEAIKISNTARLLDGQHRLHALIKYGKPLNFLVISDLNDDIFSVLDTGQKRNAGDVLSISGIDNANEKAAGIINWFTISQNKVIRTNGTANKNDLKINNQMILDEYNNRPEYWDQLSKDATSKYRTFGATLSKAFIMGWSARLLEIDSLKGAEFMARLCTGVGIISKNDPTAQLRNILITAKGSLTKKLDSKFKNALMIKAWNNFFLGKETARLYFNANLETYPVLKTYDDIKVSRVRINRVGQEENVEKYNTAN